MSTITNQTAVTSHVMMYFSSSLDIHWWLEGMAQSCFFPCKQCLRVFIGKTGERPQNQPIVLLYAQLTVQLNLQFLTCRMGNWAFECLLSLLTLNLFGDFPTNYTQT